MGRSGDWPGWTSTRRIAAAIAALAALVALAAAGVAPAKDVEAHRKAPPSFYGVALQEYGLSELDTARFMNGRVGAVRFVLPWSKIEQSDGHFDWSLIDSEVGAIEAAGAEPIPYIYTIPHWLPARTGPPMGTEQQRAAWTDFLHELIGRYGLGGELDAADPSFVPLERWQIWNEPNLPAFWAGAPDPEQYAELLALSERAIHEVDPTASLIVAGMPAAPRAIPAQRFIGDLYDHFAALGASVPFDEVALHAYSETVEGSVALVKSFSAAVRTAIGPAAALPPLLIGEVGWASRGKKGRPLAGTPESQAKRLNRVYKALGMLRVPLNISGVLWYAWRDAEAGTNCSFCPNVGLFNADGTPKPAWKKFRTMKRY